MILSLYLLAAVLSLTNGRQPWPVKVDRYGLCCKDLSTNLTDRSTLQTNSQLLRTCLEENRAIFTSLHKNKKIGVITFAADGVGEHKISNIDTFATYQQAIVGAYCEHRGYLFRSFNESALQESAVEQVDYRWNKLQLLLQALDPSTGWAKHLTALLWIDSDAIFLDFSFDLDLFLQQYASYDLIASQDIKLGFINSGVFLIRNTAWTRSFLQRWYKIANRSKVCDQDAFDLVYKEYSTFSVSLNQTEKSETADDPLTAAAGQKILILPMHVMNSHPPAWRYFPNDEDDEQLQHARPFPATSTSISSSQHHPQQQQRVLHLMGESSFYRGFIFQTAYLQGVCSARSGGLLPRQLGISQDLLLEVGKRVYQQETIQYFQLVNQTTTSSSFSTIEATGTETANTNSNSSRLLLENIQELMKASSHYVDLLAYIAHHHLQPSQLSSHSSRQQSQSTHSRQKVSKATNHYFVGEQREYLIEVERIRTAVMNLLLRHVYDKKQSLQELLTKMQQAQQRQQQRQLTQQAVHQEGQASAERQPVVQQQEQQPVVDQQRQQEQISLLQQEIVQLLKVAAEAGNALFWSLTPPVPPPVSQLQQQQLLLEQRLQIATIIEDLLAELIQRLSTASQPIAQHMLALLYKNVGKIHYDHALLIVMQPQHGQQHHGQHQPVVDSIKSFYYQTALQYFNQSIELFQNITTTSGSLADHHDRSSQLDGSSSSQQQTIEKSSRQPTEQPTNKQPVTSLALEYLQSYQLFATCQCQLHSTDIQRYDGRQTWLSSIILMAEQIADGLQLGRAYEQLALVYYHTAICHYDHHHQHVQISQQQFSKQHSQQQHSSHQTVVDDDLQIADKMIKQTLQILYTIQQQQNQAGGDNGVLLLEEIGDLASFITRVEGFGQQIQQALMIEQQATSTRQVDQQQQQQPIQSTRHGNQTAMSHVDNNDKKQQQDNKNRRIMQAIVDPITGQPKFVPLRIEEKDIKTAASSPQQQEVKEEKKMEEEDEEYEWEECGLEGENGTDCETFVVMPTTLTIEQQQQQQTATVAAATATATAAAAATTTVSTADKQANQEEDGKDVEAALYEGIEDEDEIAELKEIRARYARQTASAVASAAAAAANVAATSTVAAASSSLDKQQQQQAVKDEDDKTDKKVKEKIKVEEGQEEDKIDRLLQSLATTIQELQVEWRMIRRRQKNNEEEEKEKEKKTKDTTSAVMFTMIQSLQEEIRSLHKKIDSK